jgi:hypothetical protein
MLCLLSPWPLDLVARLLEITPVLHPIPLQRLQTKLRWHTAPVTTFLFQVDVVHREYKTSQYHKMTMLTVLTLSTEVISCGTPILAAKFRATAHSTAIATLPHLPFP